MSGVATKHSQPAGPRRAPRLLALLAFVALLPIVATACYSLASPKGWADPVFSGSMIYYSAGGGRLAAYDRDAQKVLWEFPSAQVKPVKLEGLYSTPVLDDQNLYVGAYNGSVYALNRATGEQRWSFDSGSAIIGGLLLKDGTLYFGNSDGHVIALQAADGSKRWQQSAGRRVWSTPAEAGNLVVFTSMDRNVYAFDAQGALAWRSTVAQAAIASSPAVQGSHVFFGAFDKHVYAIDQGKGQKLWESPTGGNWFWTRGLVTAQSVYAGNLDGHLYAFDAGDGRQKWQVDLGSALRSAPVLAQGVLVVAGRDGMVHGLDPESGKDRWPAFSAGGTVLANLVQQGDSIYALAEAGSKHNARLVQIDAASGSSTAVITP